MSLGYLFLVAAACILLAMAIDSILRSISYLNLSAALLLFTGTVITGSMGLSEFFLMGNSQWLSLTMLKAQNAAICFSGFSFLFFSFHFPRDEKPPNTRVILLPVLSFLAVLALFSFFGLDIRRVYYLSNASNVAPRIFEIKLQYNFLHYLFQTISLLIALGSVVWIGIKYRIVVLVYQKKQIRYFLTGAAFFILAYSLLPFLPTLLVYPLISVAYVFVGGLLLFTAVTYRFVNLRKNIISFIRENIIGLIVSLPLVLLLYILRPWIEKVSLVPFFLIMPPVFILFFWLFDLSIELVKRMLRMKTFETDTTENFLDRIGHSRNLEDLAKNSINVLIENINCRNADFLLFDKGKEVFKTIYSSTSRDYSYSAIDPFFRYVTADNEVYDRDVINFDPAFNNIKNKAEEYFEKNGTALMVPIFYDGNITVLINIAGKVDNTSFTAKEHNLILKLKKIVQIVLNNIILFEGEQAARLTKRDLSLASVIQESIFQKEIPHFTSMDVEAYLKPASGVSGDYFLIQKVNNNAMGVLIADVAGKGFPAALISMMIHTIAKSQEFSSVTTNAVVDKINNVMTSNLGDTRLTRTLSFATVFCGYIDYSIKTLFYTNAGHNPMIIFDPATSQFEFIKANSKPPGIFPDQMFLSGTYHFNPGKVFVLYSDGITETINREEEEFGLERLQKIIQENASQPAIRITEIIIRAVEDFAGDLEQFDDITLIIIKL